MSFVDASAIVAILNEKPGFKELEKRLGEAAGGALRFAVREIAIDSHAGLGAPVAMSRYGKVAGHPAA
ncbi:ribonuclease VapC [Sinorhizobium medicae]|nr:hypothetical protein [Sinorhizobium medicae]TWA39595.1 ribonuclease VapC [Sinorhizobium medicae]